MFSLNTLTLLAFGSATVMAGLIPNLLPTDDVTTSSLVSAVPEATTTAIVAGASKPTGSVTASDTDVTDISGTGSGSTCAKNNTISCCDSSSGDNGILGNVLGGACTIPNLAIVAVDVSSVCPTGNTFCCPTTQTGDLDINAACLPLTG